MKHRKKYRWFRAISVDFEKEFMNSGFVIAVLLITALCFTSEIYRDDSNGSTYSVLEAVFMSDRELISTNIAFSSIKVFKGVFGTYMPLFLPILAALPFISSFCSEKESGYMRFSVIREGNIMYGISKYLTGIICGGIAVLFGVTLYGLAVWALFPDIKTYENVDAEYLNFIFPEGLQLTAAKTLLVAFLYGCVCSVPAVTFSSMFSNVYIIACLPSMLIYVWDTAIVKVQSDVYMENAYEKLNAIWPFRSSSILDLASSSITPENMKKTFFFNISIVLLGFVIFMTAYLRRKDRGYR